MSARQDGGGGGGGDGDGDGESDESDGDSSSSSRADAVPGRSLQQALTAIVNTTCRRRRGGSRRAR
jgi:hypothetical protein